MKIEISVVDDHNLLRKGLIQIIKKFENITVDREFEDGLDYINHVIEYPEDTAGIVLLDYHMPKMDGIEVCLWLKKNARHIKAIIISQYDDSGTIKRLVQSGASGYLLKETSLEELENAILEVSANGFYLNENLNSQAIAKLVKTKNINSSFRKNISLTKREKEVAQLICLELSYKEIADKLDISKRTVETHKDHILRKIGATKVTGIVVYAAKKGWI